MSADLKQLKEAKKILIINLGGIGDFLLSIPALRALSQAYPLANISLLAVPRVAGVAKGFPYIGKVLLFNPSRVFCLQNLAVLLALRKERFDLVLNMRTITSKKGAFGIKLILAVINPRLKAGRNTDGLGEFFDIRIPEAQIGIKPEMEYDNDLVYALGAQVKERSIGLAIDAEISESIGLMLKDEGVKDTDVLIGIHPGGMPSRRWPLENFAKVMDELSIKTKAKFIVTVGFGEYDLLEGLKKMSRASIVNLKKDLSFLELAALIKRCRLYISNDTGPMHIAAILRTPQVAIFAPGDIARYDPRYISDKAEVVYHKEPCAPCNRFICDDMRCLKAIRPEEVITASLKLYERYEVKDV